MKQDSRGLVLQAQGLQYLGERVVTTAAEAVIQDNDFTLAINLATPGPLTIALRPPANLPMEPGSARLRVRDKAGNAGTYAITLDGSGALINGASTLVINANGGNADIEWTGAEWISYAQPPGTGIVLDVTGTAPIQVTGTTTKNVAISPATTMAAGSMSAADKAKLDGITPGATATPLSNAAPQEVGTTAAGASTSASRADHVHELPDIGGGAETYSYPASIEIDDKGRVISVTDGTPAGVTSETAGAAVAVALPVMTNGSSRIVVAGTSLEDMRALRGISRSAAAANGDPIFIAGNSAKTGGIFVGLTIREAQYAAGGAIVPQSGLDAYIAGAASESWYRRIGHAISATEIYEDWGEPQQVP